MSSPTDGDHSDRNHGRESEAATDGKRIDGPTDTDISLGRRTYVRAGLGALVVGLAGCSDSDSDSEPNSNGNGDGDGGPDGNGDASVFAGHDYDGATLSVGLDDTTDLERVQIRDETEAVVRSNSVPGGATSVEFDLLGSDYGDQERLAAGEYELVARDGSSSVLATASYTYAPRLEVADAVASPDFEAAVESDRDLIISVESTGDGPDVLQGFSHEITAAEPVEFDISLTETSEENLIPEEIGDDATIQRRSGGTWERVSFDGEGEVIPAGETRHYRVVHYFGIDVPTGGWRTDVEECSNTYEVSLGLDAWGEQAGPYDVELWLGGELEHDGSMDKTITCAENEVSGFE